jgi:thioredoxin reductase (NADPH)
MSESFDVIVLGAGVAGLTATRNLAERGVAVANIEAQLFGGLIVNVNELDPAPGELASGADFASTLLSEATDLGAASLSETVTALTREGGALLVATDAGVHRARSILVATGARLRRVGIPGELELDHRGVAQCADCDGPLYNGQDVVVVGGGDSALQEALVLANYCERVLLVCRSAGFRAQPHFAEAVAARANIVPMHGFVPEAVLGTDGVTGVRLRELHTNATRDVPCSGFFAYVGLAPNTEFLPQDIERDGSGRIITDASLETRMRGVFAAGAVRAGCGGLITDAVADAERAAAACLTAQ